MADDKLIDFAAERSRRIHDLHERRLEEVREAFSAALPLPQGRKRKPGRDKPGR